MSPKQFKDIRKQLGFSQTRMARTLGLSDSRTIRYYESGKREVPTPIDILMRLFAGLKTIKDCLNGK